MSFVNAEWICGNLGGAEGEEKNFVGGFRFAFCAALALQNQEEQRA